MKVGSHEIGDNHSGNHSPSMIYA